MSRTGLTKIVTLTPKYVIINNTEVMSILCFFFFCCILFFLVTHGANCFGSMSILLSLLRVDDVIQHGGFEAFQFSSRFGLNLFSATWWLDIFPLYCGTGKILRILFNKLTLVSLCGCPLFEHCVIALSKTYRGWMQSSRPYPSRKPSYRT